jgi:vacuolar fusion protein MON1
LQGPRNIRYILQVTMVCYICDLGLYLSPPDLHILLNTVHSPSILNSSASASWIPVCLPKFNPSGFANVYVSFFPDTAEHVQSPDTPKAPQPPPISRHDSASSTSNATSGAASPAQLQSESASPAPEPVAEGSSSPAQSAALAGDDRRRRGDFETGTGVALACVSAGGDFETIRGWCDGVAKVWSLDAHARERC